ncbi:MAG: DUF5703 domain-containing protein, partial [Kiritimatiellae bacterium]|nr:DUF5703 domain-containing protein [Kiritimatiellia bacterium]
MPLGNGDVGINVWVEGNGDLLFYVSKVDAFDDRHRLPKLGRIRVHLHPNPFLRGKPFVQTLRLREGLIVVRAGSCGEELELKIWVDANHPVIRVTGRASCPIDMTVSLETVTRP